MCTERQVQVVNIRWQLEGRHTGSSLIIWCGQLNLFGHTQWLTATKDVFGISMSKWKSLLLAHEVWSHLFIVERQCISITSTSVSTHIRVRELSGMGVTSPGMMRNYLLRSVFSQMIRMFVTFIVVSQAWRVNLLDTNVCYIQCGQSDMKGKSSCHCQSHNCQMEDQVFHREVRRGDTRANHINKLDHIIGAKLISRGVADHWHVSNMHIWWSRDHHSQLVPQA